MINELTVRAESLQTPVFVNPWNTLGEAIAEIEKGTLVCHEDGEKMILHEVRFPLRGHDKESCMIGIVTYRRESYDAESS